MLEKTKQESIDGFEIAVKQLKTVSDPRLISAVQIEPTVILAFQSRYESFVRRARQALIDAVTKHSGSSNNEVRKATGFSPVSSSLSSCVDLAEGGVGTRGGLLQVPIIVYPRM